MCFALTQSHLPPVLCRLVRPESIDSRTKARLPLYHRLHSRASEALAKSLWNSLLLQMKLGESNQPSQCTVAHCAPRSERCTYLTVFTTRVNLCSTHILSSPSCSIRTYTTMCAHPMTGRSIAPGEEGRSLQPQLPQPLHIILINMIALCGGV